MSMHFSAPLSFVTVEEIVQLVASFLEDEWTHNMRLTCSRWQQALPVRPWNFEDFEFSVSNTNASVFMQICRHKRNNRCYCARRWGTTSRAKRFTAGGGSMDHQEEERSARETMRSLPVHPFIMKLVYEFDHNEVDTRKALVILEFCSCDLFALIKEAWVFDVATARFYICELILAVEHLHRNNLHSNFRIMPEKCMIASDGHLKFRPLSMSIPPVACNSNVFDLFDGTEDICYFPPEVILQQRNCDARAVDWYHVGMLLYEMMTGLPAFYDDNKAKMLEKIVKAPLVFRKPLPAHAEDLIRRLVDRDPSARLANGAAVKSHKFFDGVDWHSVLRRELCAPPLKPPPTRNNEPFPYWN